MPTPDYYAILQVHPEAEGIVIEAAYRRLAREYHPDVNRAANAHDRMVLINEAFEVLSDAARRRSYDHERRGATTQSSSSSARQETRSTNATAEREPPPADQGISPPIPPNPSDFGIDSAYWDRVLEGAYAWRQRKPFLSKTISTSIRVSGWLAGGALFALGSTPAGQATLAIPPFLWFGIPITIESLFVSFSTRHDAWLRKTVFDPTYNPAPDAYSQFAQEYARYEAEFTKVYVARTGYRFHGNQFCGNMSGPFELPKYVATAKGYTPCSRCSYITVRPRLLPPPFGRGPEPPPVAEPAADNAPRPIRDRTLMWVGGRIATAGLISCLAWFAFHQDTVPPKFPLSPVGVPVVKKDPAMEDFSKLTPEQIDNLKAERDFSPDDAAANPSAGRASSTPPLSSGKGADGTEDPNKDFVPAKPDGFDTQSDTNPGKPTRSTSSTKNSDNGSTVKLGATHPSSQATGDGQLAALDEQSRRTTAERLHRLGYEADWQSLSELQMLDIESRITTANRLKRLGYPADWQKETVLGMLDIESRITTANRLKRLGYIADWHKETTLNMLDIESRITTANRLKAKGIAVDWRTHSSSDLLGMEIGH